MARAPIPKPTGPGATDPRTAPVRTVPRDNLPEILGPRGAAQSQRSAALEQMEVIREELPRFSRTLILTSAGTNGREN